MRIIYIIIILFCTIVASGYATDTSNKSLYAPYIDSQVLETPYASISQFENNNEPLVKALVLFRKALKDSLNEQQVRESFEYWQSLYNQAQPTYRNFVHLAYVGTLEAMLGGAIRGVIKKTRLAKAGMNKLALAVEQADSSRDPLAIAYVYFLQSQTYSNMPAFFREFKNDTVPSLKMTVKYLKKVEKSGIYSKSLTNSLLARANIIYGRFYDKSKDYKNAKKYLKVALKLSTNVDTKKATQLMLDAVTAKIK